MVSYYVLGHAVGMRWHQASNSCLFEILALTSFCLDIVLIDFFYNSGLIYRKYVL